MFEVLLFLFSADFIEGSGFEVVEVVVDLADEGIVYAFPLAVLIRNQVFSNGHPFVRRL